MEDYQGKLYPVIVSQLQALANQMGIGIIISDEVNFSYGGYPDDALVAVVHFPSSDYDGFTATVEVDIELLGANNETKIGQNFLVNFATANTLKPMPTIGGIQIWGMPTAQANFNVVDAGFRSLFILSGTVQITSDGGVLEISYGNESPLFALQKGGSLVNSMDPQASSSTDGRNKSKRQSTTETFTISTYFNKNSQFTKDVITEWGGNRAALDKVFTFTYDFGGIYQTSIDMLLSNLVFKQDNGLHMIITATFTTADEGGN